MAMHKLPFYPAGKRERASEHVPRPPRVMREATTASNNNNVDEIPFERKLSEGRSGQDVIGRSSQFMSSNGSKKFS